MKCLQCGTENNNNMFCTECGNKLVVSTPKSTKVHEIILRIGNFLLSIPLYISILMFAYVLLGTLMLGIGSATGSDVDYEKFFIDGTGEALLWLFVAGIGILILNITVGILMYKKNKNTVFVGKYKKIKKVTYALLTWFLGIYGVHRFVIKDTTGGVIRLVITIGIPFISAILSEIGMGVFSFYLVAIGMIIEYSMVISDFTIGLSRVADEDKKIYAD